MTRGETRGLIAGTGLVFVGLWYLTTGSGLQFMVGGGLVVLGIVLFASQLRRY